MKRYLFTKLNKQNKKTDTTFECDTVEEAASHFRVLDTAVQSFFNKNKKGHLTFMNCICEDRQLEVEAAKAKVNEEKIRAEAYAAAKAELTLAAAATKTTKAVSRKTTKVEGE